MAQFECPSYIAAVSDAGYMRQRICILHANTLEHGGTAQAWKSANHHVNLLVKMTGMTREQVIAQAKQDRENYEATL